MILNGVPQRLEATSSKCADWDSVFGKILWRSYHYHNSTLEIRKAQIGHNFQTSRLKNLCSASTRAIHHFSDFIQQLFGNMEGNFRGKISAKPCAETARWQDRTALMLEEICLALCRV